MGVSVGGLHPESVLGDDTAWLDGAFGRLFGAADAPYGHYVRLGGWEVLVPGKVHRCQIYRESDMADRLDLTIFHPIRGLAGELWEHEVRALMSLSAIGHPSLPEIVDGASVEHDSFAFSRTRSVRSAADQLEALAALRADPVEALRQFDSLLNGLRRLHDNRILHRNVCPDALRLAPASGDPDASSLPVPGEAASDMGRIVLTRFEMSTLVANLVRGSSVDRAASAEELRSLQRGPADEPARGRHLAYIAPERTSFVLENDSRVPRDWDTSDLYAIGVLAYELFVGSLEDLRELADLRTSATSASHERLRRSMRERVRNRRTHQDHHLPKPLCELITALLESDPKSRWNAHNAAGFLEENWSSIVGVWHGDRHDPPLLVAFMPSKCAKTLYEQRSWLQISPLEAAGRDELRGWLERELGRAEIVHSPRGAVGYATNDDPQSLEEAEWVLLGERVVWFCAYLRNPQVEERVLVIKYFRERERAGDLLRLQPRRRLDRIELFSWETGQPLADFPDGSPSWRPILDPIQRRAVRNEDDMALLDAMDFLLQYQQLELDAREYAVVVVPSDERDTLLRTDSEREAARRHSSPLLSAYCADERRRPRLAAHFSSLGDDSRGGSSRDAVIKLQLAPDIYGRPDWRSARDVTLGASAGSDPDVMSISTKDGRVNIDGKFWIRHADDSAARVAHGRQVRARPGLEARPTLVSKLRNPVSVTIRRPRRSNADPDLKGEAPDIVQEILAAFPIHAVQGPPGTGKTTVAVEALRLYLQEEPSARVLVSAQSNYALDHLGSRIIKRFEKDGIDALVVREIPPNFDEDRLLPLVREHTMGRLTKSTIEGITAEVGDRLHGLEGEPLTSLERRVLQDWYQAVQKDQVEIAHRLRRSAAVVLATCSMAGARFTESVDRAALFDWVIIEEAGKAWPTELVIPLLLGSKWTLIGDHKQLGAFRSEDVRRFLEAVKHDPDDEVVIHAERANTYLRVLNLFGSMFERPSGDTPKLSTSRLSKQFRMADDIAEPVSRAFYPVAPAKSDDIGPLGSLQTASRKDPDHPFSTPSFLRGHSLVWIDTTADARCGDEAYWFNEGEADIVRDLFLGLTPRRLRTGSDGDGSVAILTPYRMQLRWLNDRIGEDGLVHTVHSFQGREADCVIVSLVRDRRRGNDSRADLGHVDQPEVANVLLSRAKRLNILVGSLDHFAQFGSTHWKTVCAVVQARALLIPSVEVQ